jgi:hypothetical protein
MKDLTAALCFLCLLQNFIDGLLKERFPQNAIFLLPRLMFLFKISKHTKSNRYFSRIKWKKAGMAPETLCCLRNYISGWWQWVCVMN